MSWIQKLYETYDRCAGLEQFEHNPLPPISHAERQAHLEIVLDGRGFFRRASIVPKEATLIPVTEKSAGQTSGAVAHPLCDKIKYVAADYKSPFGKKPVHDLYLRQLRSWVAFDPNPKLAAILKYVERGEIVRNLVEQKLLWKNEQDKLITEWHGESVPIAKLLSPDPKTKLRDQGDALVRWRVELDNELESAVWKDPKLRDSWIRYDAALGAEIGLCMVTGEQTPLAFNHPKGLRYGGDAAKLISSNDKSGYTFRGKFRLSSEAYGVGSVVTQKVHHTLRWLIARQGIQGSPVIISWAIAGQPTPRLGVSTEALIRGGEQDELRLTVDEAPTEMPSGVYEGDAGQAFAARLDKLIRGYEAQLGERDDIVVLALDSATKARMAVLYYRELQGSEFLKRIQNWHQKMAWQQNLGMDLRFTGAPAPTDIAKAAYGRRIEGKEGGKLQRATVERLLPCIVDGQPIPRDLVQSCIQRTVGRLGLKRSKSGYEKEFEFCLGVACSMLKGSRPEGEYKMSLDEKRTTRSYLYGRLLAVAENIERFGLNASGENRDTSAGRLMQRFSDHPFETWMTIAKQLRPYETRLRSNPANVGFIESRQQLLAQIGNLFETEDFIKKSKLDGEFLLAYYCQRESLYAKSVKNRGKADQGQHIDEIEGDIE